MALTVQALFLTADRSAQLDSALASVGTDRPLETLVAEAEAKVQHYAAGYVVDDHVRDGFARILALYQAFVIAETTVPEDLRAAHTEVMDALRAIAAGDVENLPVEDEDLMKDTAAAWGSEPRIATTRV